MRKRTFKVWVLACLSGLVALSARAAEPGEFASILSGHPVAGKTFACFTRSYDKAFFATHQFQRITAVRLLAVVNSAGDYGVQLRIGLNLRDRLDALATGADCKTPASLDLPAICSGQGGGHATLSIESKDVVRLGLSTFGQLPPKGSAYVEDDKNFRLVRAPLAKCDDQAENAEEKTLLDRDR